MIQLLVPIPSGCNSVYHLPLNDSMKKRGQHHHTRQPFADTTYQYNRRDKIDIKENYHKMDMNDGSNNYGSTSPKKRLWQMENNDNSDTDNNESNDNSNDTNESNESDDSGTDSHNSRESSSNETIDESHETPVIDDETPHHGKYGTILAQSCMIDSQTFSIQPIIYY